MMRRLRAGRTRLSDPAHEYQPSAFEGETDESVFVAFRNGDSAAYRELIERYHDDLLRFLTRLVGNRAAAEDLFQETFLQIHLSADSFDASRRFRPWLFTIAANKGRDLLRKKKRRRTVELSAPLKGSDRGASMVDLLEIDVPAPDERMDASEQDRLVQLALDDLGAPLREVLVLGYFQRLSYARIAEDLGIPLGTVKSRMHAAVAAFARSWQRVSRPDARDE